MQILQTLDRAIRFTAICALPLAAVVSIGCAQEAPEQAAVPVQPGANYVPHQAAPKPLPESAMNPQPGPGPYDDSAILQQRLPEEQYFLDAYNKVDQPRVAIYVNRTLTGQMIPPNPGGPVETEERTQSASGSVNVSNGGYSEHADAYGRDVQSGQSSFQSNGPAQYTETNTRYEAPGDMDEADVRSLDYDAIEKILTDWMSCGGRVHVVSSDYLAAQLSPAEMEALSQGKPIAMNDLFNKVGADVLIQVQAHPTRQVNGGTEIRLVAQAMNVRGGDLLGTAVVDVPLPLEKPRINDFTRFIAAKLMVSMAGAWDSYSNSPPPPGAQNNTAPPGSSAPQPMQSGLPPVPPASGSSLPPDAPVSASHLPPVPTSAASSLPPAPTAAASSLPPVPPASGSSLPPVPASAPPASQPTQQMNFIP